jgi:hypothetical protein
VSFPFELTLKCIGTFICVLLSLDTNDHTHHQSVPVIPKQIKQNIYSTAFIVYFYELNSSVNVKRRTVCCIYRYHYSFITLILERGRLLQQQVDVEKLLQKMILLDSISPACQRNRTNNEIRLWDIYHESLLHLLNTEVCCFVPVNNRDAHHLPQWP